MSNLYQLPITGDWIDANAVKSIRYLRSIPESRRLSGDALPPRVTVEASAAFFAVIECETEEAALTLRDKIAAEVNEARKP